GRGGGWEEGWGGGGGGGGGAGGEGGGEILAGTEAAAGAGEQQRPAGRIAFRLVERGRKRLVHGFVERIEPLRTVEADEPVALAQIDEDGTFVHERTSRVR